MRKKTENHWSPEPQSLHHCLPDQMFRTMTVAMNSITNLIPKHSGAWTAYNRQQRAAAPATSKGRSTSHHSTTGTYDNHVTHFLHDNVTVEFHYWRIDWGIEGAANLSLGEALNGVRQRADDSHRTHCTVQINVNETPTPKLTSLLFHSFVFGKETFAFIKRLWLDGRGLEDTSWTGSGLFQDKWILYAQKY